MVLLGLTPLSEDNVEHGLGMYLGQATRSSSGGSDPGADCQGLAVPALKEAGQKWLDTMRGQRRQRRGHQGIHRRPGRARSALYGRVKQ